MLRAYDYLTLSPDRNLLQSGQSFSEEMTLVKQAVDKIGAEKSDVPPLCPVCGAQKMEFFFEKWGVGYFWCPCCESLLAGTSPETVRAYRADEAVLSFRTSRQYQNDAYIHRKHIWENLHNWISFRSFRYLGRNQGLKLSELGNRYSGFSQLLKNSALCGKYAVRDSLVCADEGTIEKSDVVLSLDRIQQTLNPDAILLQARDALREDGLLFLSVRVGTGFDILTLREHSQIYPYEYVLLPSISGLQTCLARAGFTLMEYSTPGQMDVGYVYSMKEHIRDGDYFVKSLMRNSTQATLAEFQRFLQKSGMSSYAHIVARKQAPR